MSGYKAILTKWFRSTTPTHKFKKDKNECLPALTRNGFLLTDAPKDMYHEVLDFYHANRTHASTEDIPEFIQGDSSKSLSQLVEMPEALRARIHTDLQLPVESWIGDYVEPTYVYGCLLYTSPSPRDRTRSRMPSSA